MTISIENKTLHSDLMLMANPRLAALLVRFPNDFSDTSFVTTHVASSASYVDNDEVVDCYLVVQFVDEYDANDVWLTSYLRAFVVSIRTSETAVLKSVIPVKIQTNGESTEPWTVNFALSQTWMANLIPIDGIISEETMRFSFAISTVRKSASSRTDILADTQLFSFELQEQGFFVVRNTFRTSNLHKNNNPSDRLQRSWVMNADDTIMIIYGKVTLLIRHSFSELLYEEKHYLGVQSMQGVEFFCNPFTTDKKKWLYTYKSRMNARFFTVFVFFRDGVVPVADFTIPAYNEGQSEVVVTVCHKKYYVEILVNIQDSRTRNIVETYPYRISHKDFLHPPIDAAEPEDADSGVILMKQTLLIPKLNVDVPPIPKDETLETRDFDTMFSPKVSFAESSSFYASMFDLYKLAARDFAYAMFGNAEAPRLIYSGRANDHALDMMIENSVIKKDGLEATCAIDIVHNNQLAGKTEKFEITKLLSEDVNFRGNNFLRFSAGKATTALFRDVPLGYVHFPATAIWVFVRDLNRYTYVSREYAVPTFPMHTKTMRVGANAQIGGKRTIEYPIIE